MSRYIDADALIGEFEKCSYETWSKGVNRAWWAQAVKVKDNIVECIKRQPTANVVEVRHGYWEYVEEYECYICSNCKAAALNNYRGLSVNSHYCPDCGAIMDGERREENEG